jgi:hypothetical protein
VSFFSESKEVDGLEVHAESRRGAAPPVHPNSGNAHGLSEFILRGLVLGEKLFTEYSSGVLSFIVQPVSWGSMFTARTDFHRTLANPDRAKLEFYSDLEESDTWLWLL